MNGKHKFKVGDKIIDIGQVHRIFKIKKKENSDGETEKLIFYKPFFKSEKDPSLICSISQSNLSETNLRRPASKKKIKETLKLLSKEPETVTKVDVRTASVYSKNNDLAVITRSLKMLWWERVEKKYEGKSLTSKKKRVYQNAMRHLTEEISIVEGISLKKAKEKIKRRLRKIGPEKPEEENGN